jgi:DNA-binding phage protein
LIATRGKERGDANPTLATLVSVTAALEVPIHRLLADCS